MFTVWELNFCRHVTYADWKTYLKRVPTQENMIQSKTAETPLPFKCDLIATTCKDVKLSKDYQSLYLWLIVWLSYPSICTHPCFSFAVSFWQKSARSHVAPFCLFREVFAVIFSFIRQKSTINVINSQFRSSIRICGWSFIALSLHTYIPHRNLDQY